LRLVVLFVALGTTTFTLNMLELIQTQRTPEEGRQPPDRVRRARVDALASNPRGSR